MGHEVAHPKDVLDAALAGPGFGLRSVLHGMMEGGSQLGGVGPVSDSAANRILAEATTPPAFEQLYGKNYT